MHFFILYLCRLINLQLTYIFCKAFHGSICFRYKRKLATYHKKTDFYIPRKFVCEMGNRMVNYLIGSLFGRKNLLAFFRYMFMSGDPFCRALYPTAPLLIGWIYSKSFYSSVFEAKIRNKTDHTFLSLLKDVTTTTRTDESQTLKYKRICFTYDLLAPCPGQLLSSVKS